MAAGVTEGERVPRELRHRYRRRLYRTERIALILVVPLTFGVLLSTVWLIPRIPVPAGTPSPRAKTVQLRPARAAALPASPISDVVFGFDDALASQPIFEP